MWKVVGRERKFLAQLSVEMFERRSEFPLNPLARGRFFQVRKIRDRIGENNPDPRAPQRQPAFLRVEAIAADDYARHDWNAGDVRKGRCTRPKGRAFE